MRTREALRQAKQDGALAGENAAAWAFDGNTSLETYARILKGIEEGDPEILDAFNTPNLSGEYADGPTPASLADQYGIENRDWVLDQVCDAWLGAASDAFWKVVEHTCRSQVEQAAKDEARTGRAQ
jgi:hypothetical protein